LTEAIFAEDSQWHDQGLAIFGCASTEFDTRDFERGLSYSVLAAEMLDSEYNAPMQSGDVLKVRAVCYEFQAGLL